SGAILTQLAGHTPLLMLVAAYVLFGLGAGMLGPPITNTAIAGMPPAQAGVAGAVASTSRQIGQTLGVALFGALAGSATGVVTGRFPAATHASWWLVLAIGVCIAILGLLSTSAWARGTAARTAQLFREEPVASGPPALKPSGVAAR
ncbi:MAG: MFS transporter, partial [Solirubrobacteraceae bacterium]